LIVYKALNTGNGRAYIGATQQQLKNRAASHVKSSQSPQTHFHRAIKKYGAGMFEWEVLEKCQDAKMLDERERYWIEAHDSIRLGYNSSPGQYLRDIGEGNKKKRRGGFITRSGYPSGEKWLAWHKERDADGLCYCIKCYHKPSRIFKGMCPSARQKAGHKLRGRPDLVRLKSRGKELVIIDADFSRQIAQS